MAQDRNETSRRAFLGTTGLAGSLCLLGRANAATERAENGPRDVGAVRTRPNIKSLDPAGPEIVSLRKGVAVMMQRDVDSQPGSDPTGWLFQAAMHGVNAPYYYWNQCQHGTWWFFPWHRLYVYYFERILRKASGDDKLMLPYWGWDDLNDASQQAIPVAFRFPADPNANSLYDPSRNTALNDPSNPATLPDFDPSYALGLDNFIGPYPNGFGGQQIGPLSSPQDGHDVRPHGGLEYYPHDLIHNSVSGNMGSPATAALDPIFWLHHANIDRLWKIWHRRNPAVHLDPTDNSDWMNQTFLFYDETGTLVNPQVAVKDVLDTEKDLGYRYEDDPRNEDRAEPVVQRPRRRPSDRKEMVPMNDHAQADAAFGAIVAATDAPAGAAFGADPIRVALALPDDAGAAVDQLARSLFDPKAGSPTFTLIIEGIKFEVDPGAPYGIYLNLPAADARPCNTDVHFAGALAFFGLYTHPMPAGKLDKNAPPPPIPDRLKGGSRGGGGDYALDVTRTVLALKGLNLWNSKSLSVTLIRHDPIDHAFREPKPDAPAPRATFQRISLRIKRTPEAERVK